MTALRSLGVCPPPALQHLVGEGLLAPDGPAHAYTRQAFAGGDELLTTAHHVVWSRGGVVRKVFSFAEPVVQALLTSFPVDEPAAPRHAFLTQGTQPATDPAAPVDTAPPTRERLARALVVFLVSQAHVFFLAGATHVVNLPFHVDRAFPAARGVVVQRSLAPLRPPTPPTPPLPPAPPNSFLTTTPSFAPSTSPPARHHGPALRAERPTPPRLSDPAAFLDDMVSPATALSLDAIPRLYSFTDPLAELGLVVNVVVGGERGGLLTTHGSGHRRLEALDKAEEVLYLSPQNEVVFDRSGNDKPLLLVVTANHETNVVTIWSAAYLEPKSMAISRKQHAPLPLSKTRRRSSHGATVPGTGATTPAARGTDRLRESVGGAPRSKTQPPSFKQASQSKERLSDQAVEDALASQLNPDSDIVRQPRESRRVSSLLSRAELSTSFDKSAFQDLATSRNSLAGSFSASFGASQRSRRSMGHDRMSLGGGLSQSRHRASTPGSVASRMSLGAASIDDTLEDVMDEDTFDTIEDYDELDDLFAPPDAASDSRLGDGLHKELVMSVVAEIPVTQHLRSGRFALSDPSDTQVRQVQA